MQSPEPLMFVQLEQVPFPDWLIDLSFCETNKQYVETEEINEFVRLHLLPIVAEELGCPEGLHVTASHVHCSSDGLTPHDHLPHHYTSVLYLMDAEGDLIVHADLDHRVHPVEGRFVLMDARLKHSVEASDCLRISLVTNYATSPL
ncbi:hypothetical protein D9M68_17730 [compost metagenome]